MDSRLNLLKAGVRGDKLRRAARARGRSGERSPHDPPATMRQVTLRFAFPDDEEPVTRLAALDSAEPPAMPLLLAEVEGELWAAVSLLDGGLIADPFRPTVPGVELLRARARQLQEEVAPPRRSWLRRGWGLTWLGSRLGA